MNQMLTGLRSSPETLERFAEAVERYGLRAGYEVLAEAHTTSDFPILLGNEMNKALQAAYRSEDDSWRRIVRERPANDFREIKVVRVSEADDLLPVGELEEYQGSTLSETAEGYRLVKHGREFGVAWETIVNDDLNAIVEQPQRFGRSAARLDNSLVWSILQNNPVMGDGKPLFHANHGNLITDALSESGLEKALVAMRTQRDDKGNPITIRPRFLVVPPHLEVAARKLVNSTASIQAANAGVINPFQGVLEVISTPWLTDPNDWYVVADPASVPGIEVAYLRLIGPAPQLFVQEPGWRFVGGGTPDIRQGVGLSADEVRYRVRHVRAAKAIDWRFAVKAQVA